MAESKNISSRTDPRNTYDIFSNEGILSNISSYLNEKDLVLLLQVSPTFRYKIPQIIEKWYLQFPYEMYFFNRFIFPNNLHMKNLKTLWVSLTQKRLRKLVITLRSDNIIEVLCEKIGLSFPFLRSLSLSHRIPAPSVPELEYLSKLKNLTSLTLNIGKLSDEKFRIISLNFPKLKFLRCSFIADATDDSIKYLAKLTCLERLEMHGAFSGGVGDVVITSKSLLILSNNLKNLQNLYFKNHVDVLRPHVEIPSIFEILPKFNNLQDLSFSLLSNRGMDPLIFNSRFKIIKNCRK